MTESDYNDFIQEQLAFDAELRRLLPPMPDDFEPQIMIYVRHKDSEISAIFTPDAVKYPQHLMKTIQHLKMALWQATEQDMEAARELFGSRKPSKVN